MVCIVMLVRPVGIDYILNHVSIFNIENISVYPTSNAVASLLRILLRIHTKIVDYLYFKDR